MRLSTSTLLALSLALINVNAEDEIEHPEFSLFDLEKLASNSFFEQFDSNWDSRWKISQFTDSDSPDLKYKGKWSVEESIVNKGFNNDKGLVVKSEASHHAISAKLPQVFDNKDNTLVLQYEVKLQKGLDCGGAYIKLLSENDELHNQEFNNDSSYQVMFGPDKCGNNNKVHFIIRRKDINTGEYEEKHLAVPPMSRVVKTTSLYTLIIKPDQDFEIRINGDVVKAGNLLTEDTFQPGFNPPKMIKDLNAIKPEDWDDNEMIQDPEVEKPEDWDESQPFTIPDPEAEKPEDWDEEAELLISDPTAEKPEDWDDEDDGEWMAPKISNPECEYHGCGPWKAPRIRNPLYKGKWKAPMVKNPNYKGDWEPEDIPNPDYYEDKTPSDLEPIGALGFELWTMSSDILFDNIYLGHSIEEAEIIGNTTFIPKVAIEEQEAAASAPKPQSEPENPLESEEVKDTDAAETATADIGEYVSKLAAQYVDIALFHIIQYMDSVNAFIVDVLDDPSGTILNRPGEAFYYSSIFTGTFVTITLFFSLIINFLTDLVESKVSTTPKTTTTSEKKRDELLADDDEDDEDDEDYVPGTTIIDETTIVDETTMGNYDDDEDEEEDEAEIIAEVDGTSESKKNSTEAVKR
ncbi:hypothetical protein B5S31_g27 [[Candida] boidinii]|nr:hypothetical protein B5S31_g27 [[Candida] boidinii]